MNIKAVKKQCKTLELDKVLSILSGYAYIDDSKEKIINLLPDIKYDRVRLNVNRTNDAYTLIAKFGAPSFYGAKNPDFYLERVKLGGVLGFTELMDIANLLFTVNGVIGWSEHFSGSMQTTLDVFIGGLSKNKYLEEKIHGIILTETEISDTASDELFNIRRKIKHLSSSVRDKLNSVLHSLSSSNALQEAIITQRNGRYVVPVKAEHRAKVKGLVHDTSASGATLFVEPMAVVEVNNEIQVLKNKEQEEIARILAQLSGEVLEFADSIKYSFENLVILDVIFAKAKYAFDINATLPVINNEGKVELKKARHPLIRPEKVVPITVSMGDEYDTLVITGPNTGGKTVTLKTVGLLTLMAMCGMFIPAGDNSSVNVYNKIYADIGDEQDIAQSLSTFSSHMVNIIHIVNNSDDNSLVLMDELGAGTDPIEGAALAISIINYLRSIGATVITTTHYAELKAYALNTEGIENASQEFDVQTLKPTYKLLVGIPGRSNAFAISGKLGLKQEIIDGANELISEENKNFEKVVSSLEEANKQAEEERRRAEKIRHDLEKLEKKNSNSLKAFEAERKRIIDEANAQAALIVEKARRQADDLLDELKELKRKINKKNSAEIYSKAKSSIKTSFKKQDENYIETNDYAEDYELPRPLKKGDAVYLVDFEDEGVVLALPKSDGSVKVQMGFMSVTTNVKNLRLIDEKTLAKRNKKKDKKASVNTGSVSKDRSAKTEIDLRGLMADEAMMELDKFIDNALLSGIKCVWIIHGKGSGALRKATHSMLRTHKSVSSYRLGTFGEGEDGVTIAELK